MDEPLGNPAQAVAMSLLIILTLSDIAVPMSRSTADIPQSANPGESHRRNLEELCEPKGLKAMGGRSCVRQVLQLGGMTFPSWPRN